MFACSQIIFRILKFAFSLSSIPWTKRDIILSYSQTACFSNTEGYTEDFRQF